MDELLYYMYIYIYIILNCFYCFSCLESWKKDEIIKLVNVAHSVNIAAIQATKPCTISNF